METELIKLKVKKESSFGEPANLIKEKFIQACVALDASILEPMIEEETYFDELDKYRFLQSLKDEFDACKEKGSLKTVMIKGNCESCHCGDEVYQFYTKNLTPAFAYMIDESNNEIENIFMCNLSTGMTTIDMSKLKRYDFWREIKNRNSHNTYISYD